MIDLESDVKKKIDIMKNQYLFSLDEYKTSLLNLPKT